VRRAITIRVNNDETKMLGFICKMLSTTEKEFLRRVIPIHFREVYDLYVAQNNSAASGAGADAGQPADASVQQGEGVAADGGGQ
jgi:predicted DNA-binding protein